MAHVGVIVDCGATAVPQNPTPTLGHKHLLSGLYGALGGLLAGGALLGILWYFYGIEFLLSVYIAGPMAVLLLIGMSLSVACRCIVCILVPELLGKYGRWVLYSLLLAALVSGPVSNISTNMERMSNSMSCSVEMIKNQTKDLCSPWSLIKKLKLCVPFLPLCKIPHGFSSVSFTCMMQHTM